MNAATWGEFVGELNQQISLRIQAKLQTQQSTAFKKKWKRSGQGNQRSQPPKKNLQSYSPCAKCGKAHLGECRAGNLNVYYRYNKTIHYVKQCSNLPNYGNAPTQIKNPAPKGLCYAGYARRTSDQLREARSAKAEARIYAYTKGGYRGRNNQRFGRKVSCCKFEFVYLAWFGATHSFISTIHANRLDKVKDVISQTFRTSLHLEDVLISTHWLRAVSVIVSER